MQKSTNKITTYGISITAILLFLAVTFFISSPNEVKAAASISVKEINYSNSTITLQVNDGDTEVYFSDSTKKTWETVPGEISSNNTITMDISWVSVSKNYIMTFKGNSSTSVISVTLPKQVTNFKASYNKVKGSMSFSNAGTRVIQWRKKGSTIWNTVDTGTIATELSYLYNNGATVYFRLAPVNGTSVTNVGYRASKEVTITIPKRVSAPTITIDGSKFLIAIKKNMAYRTVYSDSTTSDWTTVNSASNLLLKDIAAKVMYTNESTALSEVTLQFRMNATSSTQVSRITTVTVPIQEGPPSVDTYGISLSYTSSSSVSLQVKAASTIVPFEYTVVKEDDVLDYLTAKWTAITSSTAVSLDDVKAPEGSHIYIRKKSITAIDTADFTLASVERDICGVNGLEYPEAPEANTLTTLITTAGVCKATDSTTYLTFNLYSATSTIVSSISFADQYGITKGAVTCKSSVVKNTGSTGSDDKYIITTKITSTSDIDSITEQLLYAKITLANTDVITSNDTAGVRLYLYPGTVVNNPDKVDDADEYTDNFKRVYLSNDTDDDRSFKFQLDLGTRFIASTSTINSFTSEAVAISSIKYDGYTLVKDTDYNVTYSTYVNEDDETVATATVTVYVDKFEASSLINATNTKLPLVIKLNNGEVLNDDIYITLTDTATLNNAPIAWSITEGSLKETKTTTVTDDDGNTTTITEEVITYTLTLTVFDKNYAVGIHDVTWGGISIFGSAQISNGIATIYLSNAKINKLQTSSSDTKNIIITFSNGYSIKSGCKLTILNATQ